MERAVCICVAPFGDNTMDVGSPEAVDFLLSEVNGDERSRRSARTEITHVRRQVNVRDCTVNTQARQHQNQVLF